jgi:hypothetical protein
MTTNTIQGDFIAALVALTPEGLTARQQSQFANTGVIYYSDGDFQVVLGVGYSFQDCYASFNLTAITDDERRVVGTHNTSTKPHDLTWDGWIAQYAKGGLKKVRDGVAWLLETRTAST